MKCSNCGMENIVEDAVHCPNCGASLITPGNWDGKQAAPQPQYQQPPAQGPQPQYQQPPQQQYYPPKAAKAQRVPTVKNVGMTEILSLFSGFFLLIVGWDNLSVVKQTNFYGGQVFALGLIALLVGLFILAMVIMPAMFKRMDKMDNITNYILLVLSLAFVVYGFMMIFANYSRISGILGFDGAELFAAGLALLGAIGLKMGLLK
jgi:hypothetical protein